MDWSSIAFATHNTRGGAKQAGVSPQQHHPPPRGDRSVGRQHGMCSLILESGSRPHEAKRQAGADAIHASSLRCVCGCVHWRPRMAPRGWRKSHAPLLAAALAAGVKRGVGAPCAVVRLRSGGGGKVEGGRGGEVSVAMCLAAQAWASD